MTTLLQYITDKGLVFDSECDGYCIHTAPFTQLSVYFDNTDSVDVAGNTFILLNDIDSADGCWYDEYDEFSPDDDESAIAFFEEMYTRITSDDITSQVDKGVAAKNFLEMANNIAGESRFQFN